MASSRVVPAHDSADRPGRRAADPSNDQTHQMPVSHHRVTHQAPLSHHRPVVRAPTGFLSASSGSSRHQSDRPGRHTLSPTESTDPLGPAARD